METTDTSAGFDTKIAVLLRDDLALWQRLNVAAFLVSGLGTRFPSLIAEPCEDADGTRYPPMFGRPVLVFEADEETLTKAHTRALAREVGIAAGPVEQGWTMEEDAPVLHVS